MKISKIICKDGEEIKPADCVNLIIGANNTGKSTFIKELGSCIKAGYIIKNSSKWLQCLILGVENLETEVSEMFSLLDSSDMSIKNLGNFETHQFLKESGFKANRQNITALTEYNAGLLEVLAKQKHLEIPIEYGNNQSQNIDSKWIARRLLAETELSEEYCDTRLNEQFLDNIARVSEISQYDSTSMVRALIKDNKLLTQLKKYIKNTFGVNIGFDDLKQGERALRILPDKNKTPSKKEDEYARSLLWDNIAPFVKDQGDGLRAFMKLVFNMFDEYYKMIIIDEPEAFLHPPQRRALGEIIAEMSERSNKQIFISTHDADFINGILIGSKQPKKTKVFRITNRDSRRKITEYNLETINDLVSKKNKFEKNNKLKIYTEAFLRTLFFEKTILTEGEYDKVFYEYFVSLYLNEHSADINFIGLNGKSTVKNIFNTFASMDINTVCIVDLDFLLDHNDAPDFVKKQNPSLYQQHAAFSKLYKQKEEKLKEDYKQNMKHYGLKYFEKNEPNQYEKIRNMIEEYEKIGIFIVPVGELEQWYGTSKNNAANMLSMMERTKKLNLIKFMKKVIKY